jgi:hypothetical protein
MGSKKESKGTRGRADQPVAILPGRGLLALGLVWAVAMNRSQPAKREALLTD